MYAYCSFRIDLRKIYNARRFMRFITGIDTDATTLSVFINSVCIYTETTLKQTKLSTRAPH